MFREWLQKAEHYLAMCVLSDTFARQFDPEERVLVRRALVVLSNKLDVPSVTVTAL